MEDLILISKSKAVLCIELVSMSFFLEYFLVVSVGVL